MVTKTNTCALIQRILPVHIEFVAAVFDYNWRQVAVLRIYLAIDDNGISKAKSTDADNRFGHVLALLSCDVIDNGWDHEFQGI